MLVDADGITFIMMALFRGLKSLVTNLIEPSAVSAAQSSSMASRAAQSNAAPWLGSGAAADQRELAYFAGGCFWGVELVFQRQHGVLSTRVGYMQGQKENPTYKQVCSGSTGGSARTTSSRAGDEEPTQWTE